MSCPDWAAIAAARAADPLVDPPGFDAARSHLAECESCRRSAAAIDPLLLFASLGRPDRAAERAIDSDNAAMTASVLAMVRASRVDAGETPASRRSALAARLTGLAAGLLVASLLALSGTPGRAPSPEPPAAPDAPLSVAAELSAPDLLALERLLEASESAPMPVVEEIDRPDARVYDLSHAELAVVMIVDASLDV